MATHEILDCQQLEQDGFTWADFVYCWIWSAVSYTLVLLFLIFFSKNLFPANTFVALFLTDFFKRLRITGTVHHGEIVLFKFGKLCNVTSRTEYYRFAVKLARNLPAVLCFHNFAMDLTAHIHNSATSLHKGDAAKSARKVALDLLFGFGDNSIMAIVPV